MSDEKFGVREVDLIYAPGEESERQRETGEHIKSVMANLAKVDVSQIEGICGAYRIKAQTGEEGPTVLFTMAGSLEDLLNLFEMLGEKILERMHAIEVLNGEHGGEA